MNNQHLTYEIALKVRKHCEAFANSDASKGHDFHKQKNLDCMCAVASYALCKALQKNGVSATMISGTCGGWRDEHCWVESDGYIIDITSTQFRDLKDKGKVFITPNNHPLYGKKEVITSYKQMKDWGNQSPKPELIKKIFALEK